jgi:hypothetical protein
VAKRRMYRGAAVSHDRPKAPEKPKPVVSAATAASTAYVLARANQHKPWARRWLRQHGEWA